MRRAVTLSDIIDAGLASEFIDKEAAEAAQDERRSKAERNLIARSQVDKIAQHIGGEIGSAIDLIVQCKTNRRRQGISRAELKTANNTVATFITDSHIQSLYKALGIEEKAGLSSEASSTRIRQLCGIIAERRQFDLLNNPPFSLEDIKCSLIPEYDDLMAQREFFYASIRAEALVIVGITRGYPLLEKALRASYEDEMSKGYFLYAQQRAEKMVKHNIPDGLQLLEKALKAAYAHFIAEKQFLYAEQRAEMMVVYKIPDGLEFFERALKAGYKDSMAKGHFLEAMQKAKMMAEYGIPESLDLYQEATKAHEKNDS